MVISWDDNHHMFMENTMLLMQLIFLCGSAIIRINLRRRWTIVSIDILHCFSFAFIYEVNWFVILLLINQEAVIFIVTWWIGMQ